MSQSGRASAGSLLAQQAICYIREHSEQKFSLPEISRALFVNRNYLARVFKHETGYTLLQYHNIVRCEKAKQLLADTDLTVAEIGSAAGYISPAHFSHQFKKITGCAPSLWRASCREPSDQPPEK